MLFPKLTNQEYEVLHEVARALYVPADWLYSLIDFESGWDPKARNPISGARGLIQFTNTTARTLFKVSGADELIEKYPDRLSQLTGPVYQYLKPYAPFPTQQSLSMAVFYPKYRNVEPNTPFPDSVIAQNPGIKTPQDYINKVFSKNIIASVAIVGGIAALFLIIYTFSQRG